jgi:hypothetical protein
MAKKSKAAEKAGNQGAQESSQEKVLVLRTCAADMSAHGGFIWPESGPVSCPDWNPEHICGYGLHGALWGEGNGHLLSWEPDAKWLVVEVLASDVVELNGKVKFPRGEVVYCGTRQGATELIQRPGRAVIGGSVTAGYYGKAMAGYYGTAMAGDRGMAMAGKGGIIELSWRDDERTRRTIGYVGEDGIEPNVPYVVKGGKLVRKG